MHRKALRGEQQRHRRKRRRHVRHNIPRAVADICFGSARFIRTVHNHMSFYSSTEIGYMGSVRAFPSKTHARICPRPDSTFSIPVIALFRVTWETKTNSYFNSTCRCSTSEFAPRRGLSTHHVYGPSHQAGYHHGQPPAGSSFIGHVQL